MRKQFNWKNTILYFLIAIIGATTVISISYAINTNQKNSKTQPEFNKDLIGKNLSSIKFYDLENNLFESGMITKGNAILIVVYTSCHACQAQIQKLEQIRTEIDNARIFLVGFENPAMLKEYSIINHITETVLQSKGDLFKELGINYFPTAIYIKDGIIKNGSIGIVDGNQINSWLHEN